MHLRTHRADSYANLQHMGIELVEHRSAKDVRRTLEALPEWFGDVDAIDNYVAAAENDDYGSLLAVAPDGVIGAALTRRHFREAAELHLIAVHPEARGTGVGRLLVERIASRLAVDGCTLLSVHTVGPSFENEPYAQTRRSTAASALCRWKSTTDLTGPDPLSSWFARWSFRCNRTGPGSRSASETAGASANGDKMFDQLK